MTETRVKNSPRISDLNKQSNGITVKCVVGNGRSSVLGHGWRLVMILEMLSLI